MPVIAAYSPDDFRDASVNAHRRQHALDSLLRDREEKILEVNIDDEAPLQVAERIGLD